MAALPRIANLRATHGADVFIPVVEKLGLMAELTYSLLRRACTAALAWAAPLQLAINISPTHLVDPLLPVKKDFTSERQCPPKRSWS